MTPAGMSPSSLIMMPSTRCLSVRGLLSLTLTPGRRARITRQVWSRHCEASVSGAGDRAGPGGRGWMPEIEEIRSRREAAAAMGGPQKVARQRASGRLTVRERIDRLADPGTFAEIGALTGFGDYDEEGRLRSVLPANFVAGTARIDGRPVMIGADDFTVRGGSGDAAFRAELEQAADPAAEIERIRRTLAGV